MANEAFLGDRDEKDIEFEASTSVVRSTIMQRLARDVVYFDGGSAVMTNWPDKSDEEMKQINERLRRGAPIAADRTVSCIYGTWSTRRKAKFIEEHSLILAPKTLKRLLIHGMTSMYQLSVLRTRKQCDQQ